MTRHAWRLSTPIADPGTGSDGVADTIRAVRNGIGVVVSRAGRRGHHGGAPRGEAAALRPVKNAADRWGERPGRRSCGP